MGGRRLFFYFQLMRKGHRTRRVRGLNSREHHCGGFSFIFYCRPKKHFLFGGSNKLTLDVRERWLDGCDQKDPRGMRSVRRPVRRADLPQMPGRLPDLRFPPSRAGMQRRQKACATEGPLLLLQQQKVPVLKENRKKKNCF